MNGQYQLWPTQWAVLWDIALCDVLYALACAHGICQQAHTHAHTHAYTHNVLIILLPQSYHFHLLPDSVPIHLTAVYDAFSFSPFLLLTTNFHPHFVGPPQRLKDSRPKRGTRPPSRIPIRDRTRPLSRNQFPSRHGALLLIQSPPHDHSSSHGPRPQELSRPLSLPIRGPESQSHSHPSRPT